MNQFAQEEKDNIAKLYSEFVPIEKIRQQYKCSLNKIKSILKDKQITIRKGSDTRKLVHTKETFINPNLKMSYLLGLIFGDGHVNKYTISIDLHKKDIEVLESVKLDISKIKYYSRNRCRLTINSRKLVEELQNEYALQSNKSKTIKFPNLNGIYLSHFISGYLTADGCLSGKNNVMCLLFVSCSSDFLNSLQKVLIDRTSIKNRNYLKEKVKSKRTFPTKNKTYELRLYGENVIKCCDYIFANTTEKTRLARKYNKYIEFKNQRNPKINNKEFTLEEKDNIIKLYSKFTPLNKIGELYNCSSTKIRKTLVDMEIIIRDRSKSKNNKKEQ